MSWQVIVYYTIAGSVLMTMAFGIVLSLLIPSLDRWSKRFFITLFSLLFLCVITAFLSLIYIDDPTKATVEKILYFFNSLLLSVPFFMPTLFLLHCAHEKINGLGLLASVLTMLSLYVVMLIVSQFTNIFYYVTPDNQFFYGPLYALTLIPITFSLIFNITATIRLRKKFSRKYFIGLMAYLVPMTVTTVVHMFFQIEIILVFCVTLFALIMFILILSDNVEQYARQQREIASQRANIMVLQMRPHFIYNSLMGIYYLFDQNSEKAKQVTLDFITYLRKSFAAIASEEVILFSEELEHTRAYLSIEQAQFEETLFVLFDTPHTSFRIPPLTLQPIVENAVVHGLRGSNEPIHISIVTRQTETANEIIVEDDGPGIQSEPNNEPHIALSNIRGRLSMMCGGTLTISPREGGGTSVKVSIPIAKAKG